MKIVIDTNVVISGTFFGGTPRRVIESVGKNGIHASLLLKLLRNMRKSLRR